MAAFGLDLDSPLLPNVDAFINPTKDEDVHRNALNAVVLNIHRAGRGGFEGLVSNNLGEYITNTDAKVRERATLLLAELLSRLPELPLLPGSAARFATFFSSRLADYPSIVPALGALSKLVKNHAPALLRTEIPPAANAGVEDASDGGAGGAGVIARGIFEELHLPALSQRVRQAALSVLHDLVSHAGLREALSSGMGGRFVEGLVRCVEGEKDPRCLVLGLSSLRRVQQGFDAQVLEESAEAVFDVTACYFPLTFTPPKNDPHKISPEALRSDLEEVLVGSPGMAKHVLPMLLDKLSSEVSTAKEASLKALVAAVRAFGAPRLGMYFREMGTAMFREAVHGSDPELSALALASLAEVVRETASYAEFTGEGEACPEWRALARPLLEAAVAEVGGDQPCSVLGRGSAKVLKALACSSALGLRSALALAVPRLLAARARGVASMGMGAAPVEGGGLVEEERNGGVMESMSQARVAAAEDEQGARLAALVGLVEAIDDKVDFSGSGRGAPLAPYVDSLYKELSNALGGPSLWGSTLLGRPSAAVAGVAANTVCTAAGGLSDLITRPPVALIGKDAVRDAVRLLVTTLERSSAWGAGLDERSRVTRGAVTTSVLAALRAIGLRRPEYEQIVLDHAAAPLLAVLAECCSSDGVVASRSTKMTDSIETDGSARDTREELGGGVVGVDPGFRGEKALEALVELSEMPRVFAVAAPGMLAAAISTGDGDSGGDKPSLRGSRTSELALRALGNVLASAAKRRHTPELAAFIRGVHPGAHPGDPLAPCPQNASSVEGPASTSENGGGFENDGRSRTWGLPLLLASLEDTPPPPSPRLATRVSATEGGSSDVAGRTSGAGGAVLRAAVSVVRTCTRAAPTSDQDALLSGLLSSIVLPGSAGGGKRGGDASEGDPGRDIPLAGRVTVEVLAAVVGAVGCDSPAFASGGAASAAVPALLRASFEEGARGLEEGRVPDVESRGGTAGRDGPRGLAPWSSAPCSQCLATVLNKLAEGPELDASVALVIGGLKEAFGARTGSGDAGDSEPRAMDVDGGRVEGTGGEVGPVHCLAWVTKAVAMRSGLGAGFSELLDVLCGLLDADGSGGESAERERPRCRRRALAAAAAFGVALGEGWEARRAGEEEGGARVSPVWRQRFFVQAFPRLIPISRGRPAKESSLDVLGDEEALAGVSNGGSLDRVTQSFSESCGVDDKQRKQDRDSKVDGDGNAGLPVARSSEERVGAGEDDSRIPPLLALLHVVRGVPPEALSPELDAVIPAVVQALRLDHAPLRSTALGTFQELLKDYLTAFGQHLSSVIPLLLDIAEGHPVGDGGVGLQAVDRFRAVECLTMIAALPYSRVHPFKAQITRRLRGPLDDRRRAVRQAAVKSRNVWFLLG